jgi:hypothetical protein
LVLLLVVEGLTSLCSRLVVPSTNTRLNVTSKYHFKCGVIRLADLVSAGLVLVVLL